MHTCTMLKLFTSFNTNLGLQDVLYHCSFESDSLDVCKMKQQTGNVYKWTRNKVIHPRILAIIILNSISNICLVEDAICSYIMSQSSLNDINTILTESRRQWLQCCTFYKFSYNCFDSEFSTDVFIAYVSL